MVEGNDDITRYHNNEMSEKERNAFEKKALRDPFLADAIEGAEEISPEEFSTDVRSLSRKILPGHSLGWKMSLRIAAGVLLVTTVGYFVYRNPLPETESLAIIKADSTTVGKQDSISSLLTLAEPKAASEAPADAKSQEPATLLKPTEQSPPTSASPTSGAGVLSPSQPGKTVDSETAVMAEPIAADAEISEQQELKKSKADESADRMAKEEAPQAASRAKRSAEVKRTISGKVMEAEDGILLPGVAVLDQETKTTTTTDFNGQYSIQTASQNPLLQFSFNGLETLVRSPGGRTSLDVELNDDSTMLSEVVILRPETGIADDAPISLATPVGGLLQYGQYLERNRQVPQPARVAKVTGKVTIAFNVSPTGMLTGFTAVKSLGYGYDEEVIRLIKNGPGWAPATQNGIPLQTTIWVKLEFTSGK